MVRDDVQTRERVRESSVACWLVYSSPVLYPTAYIHATPWSSAQDTETGGNGGWLELWMVVVDG